MSELLFFKDDTIIPFNAGLIQVDIDVDAERIVLMDRNSFNILISTIKPPSGILKLIIPISFTTNNQLLIGILDDSATYDCKFADGVKAEMVNANTVDMSQ